MTTQTPAQDVSDAALAHAFRANQSNCNSEQAIWIRRVWTDATRIGDTPLRARELQQCPNCLNDGCHCATCNPFPGELQQAQLDGCTESNCQRCTTAPYARGDMKHAGIGSYPNTTPPIIRACGGCCKFHSKFERF